MADKVKNKITFTTDARKKHDLVLGKKGFLIANKDLVILVDDNEMKNPCYAAELILSKFKRGGNNEIVPE